MIDIIISIFMLASALLALLASVGILRLPDLLTRMHASTKAGALSIMIMMTAVALHFMSLTVLAKAIAIILFIFMTAPVAAHAIGRAGYFVGVPVWSKTIKDELYDNYDPDTHRLRSGLETEEELKKMPIKLKPRIRLNTKK